MRYWSTVLCVLTLSVVMVLALAGAALGDPDLTLSTAVTAAFEPVSVCTYPDGGGHPLENCFAFGGEEIDATVTLTLVDAMADPIPDYPREDLWIETSLGGLALCTDGSLADADTDFNGQPDVWEQYGAERTIGRQVDRDQDGVRDAFFSYQGDLLVRDEQDMDGDGSIDVRSFYEDGRLVRREVLNPELFF